MTFKITEKYTDYRKFDREGFKSIHEYIIILLIVCSLIGLGILIFGIVTKIWPIIVIGCVCFLVEIIMIFVSHFLNSRDIKNIEQNFLKFNGEKTEVEYNFMPDKMTKTYWDGHVVTMYYEDIKVMVLTKTYFMILFKHDYVYYFYRDAIIPEMIDEIIDICRDKNSNIKVKKG